MGDPLTLVELSLCIVLSVVEAKVFVGFGAAVVAVVIVVDVSARSEDAVGSAVVDSTVEESASFDVCGAENVATVVCVISVVWRTGSGASVVLAGACVVPVSDFFRIRKLTDETSKGVSQSYVAASELTGRCSR